MSSISKITHKTIVIPPPRITGQFKTADNRIIILHFEASRDIEHEDSVIYRAKKTFIKRNQVNWITQGYMRITILRGNCVIIEDIKNYTHENSDIQKIHGMGTMFVKLAVAHGIIAGCKIIKVSPTASHKFYDKIGFVRPDASACLDDKKYWQLSDESMKCFLKGLLPEKSEEKKQTPCAKR